MLTTCLAGLRRSQHRCGCRVAQELLDTCLDKESKDNMSAICISFPAAKHGEGPGVAARIAEREARKRAEEEEMAEAQAAGGGGRPR